MPAKQFPFSLSESDPAYKILKQIKGNRSEWLRSAVIFYDRYQDLEPQLKRSMDRSETDYISRLEKVASDLSKQIAILGKTIGAAGTKKAEAPKAEALDDLLNKFDEGI